jgi:hypothetical protein
LWPKCEVPQCPRFGRDWMQSGHAADIAEGPSLTQSEREWLRIAVVQS